MKRKKNYDDLRKNYYFELSAGRTLTPNLNVILSNLIIQQFQFHKI